MVRLGQNFLADPNLLRAIVRDAALDPADVVLEVGGGEGVLTGALAERAAAVHVIEMDPDLAGPLGRVAAEHPSVRLHWDDAMTFDLAGLDPPPTNLVSNLPYSIATPLLLRTIAQLPSLTAWTVMVQREIGDRLRSDPGNRVYGAPSVLVQFACEVRMLRAVDPAVFVPRPRVGSALLRLERHGPAATQELATFVREGFAHRRKTLAGSLELAHRGAANRVRAGLRELGLSEDSRAEALSPQEFAELAEKVRAGS
jgi:16S rRNA (adenine1518-N6/adenine1519-N6)-dimethyltransferase